MIILGVLIYEKRAPGRIVAIGKKKGAYGLKRGFWN